MLTLEESVISEAANFLNSNEYTIKYEAANVPKNFWLNDNLSIQRNAQNLVIQIEGMRNAEQKFFEQHPELNPFFC